MLTRIAGFPFRNEKEKEATVALTRGSEKAPSGDVDFSNLIDRLQAYRCGVLESTANSTPVATDWALRVFTERELGLYCFPESPRGVYVAVSGLVYDVTELCNYHPEGMNTIVNYGGMDITGNHLIDTSHKDWSKVLLKMKDMKIGRMIEERDLDKPIGESEIVLEQYVYDISCKCSPRTLPMITWSENWSKRWWIRRQAVARKKPDCSTALFCPPHGRLTISEALADYTETAELYPHLTQYLGKDATQDLRQQKPQALLKLLQYRSLIVAKVFQINHTVTLADVAKNTRKVVPHEELLNAFVNSTQKYFEGDILMSALSDLPIVDTPQGVWGYIGDRVYDLTGEFTICLGVG
jgi:predicted heme/steroid binding protein